MTIETLSIWLLWPSAIGCGVMAGVYFTFSAFVMPSLARVEPAHGIIAMQVINKVILRSAFMPLFLFTSLAGLAAIPLGLAGSGGWMMAGGGMLYVFGMFVSTLLFNVPLNNRLAGCEPMTESGQEFWVFYLRRWCMWNHSRMAASALAAVMFMAAFGGIG